MEFELLVVYEIAMVRCCYHHIWYIVARETNCHVPGLSPLARGLAIASCLWHSDVLFVDLGEMMGTT